MTTKSRSRFQTVALLGIGALLIAFGIQTFGGVTFETPEPPPPPADTVSLGDVLLDETLPVQSGALVSLDLSSEDVIVEEGRGGAVRILIEGSTDAAREFFRDQNYEVRQNDGGAELRARPSRRAERRRVYREGNTPTVRVQVPAGMAVRYDGTSGDLQIDTLDAEALNLDTGSGDVHLGEITARVLSIGTGSGDVSAAALRVDTGVIDTGSGEVSVARSSGALEVDTGSGDVELDAHDGPLSVDTGSGDVEVRFAGRNAAEISTGSGDVSLALRDADLDVDTNGEVDIDEALGFSGANRDGTARGRVGAGGVAVTVESGSGEVSISPAR